MAKRSPRLTPRIRISLGTLLPPPSLLLHLLLALASLVLLVFLIRYIYFHFISLCVCSIIQEKLFAVLEEVVETIQREHNILVYIPRTEGGPSLPPSPVMIAVIMH